MTDETFEASIARERERLAKEKDDIIAEQRKLDEKLAAIDKQLSAISAYEAVILGDHPQTRRVPKGVRSAAPRGLRQQSILDLLQKSDSGLSRGEILQSLGLKGDKSGEQSVSNALLTLKKAGRITAKEGKYVAV